MARKARGIDKVGIYGYDSSDGSHVAIGATSAGALVASTDPADGLGNGQKTVASAGTAEVLASSTAILGVTIKALRGNTGNVYVGDSGVTSANGYVLERGAAVSMDVDNLADIYIDVDTNGEGVSFLYLTE